MFVDTNAIIEAHRVDCWRALAARFRLETVQRCEGEACTRPRRRTLAADIDAVALQRSLATSHPVTDLQRARVHIRMGGYGIELDAGERDLWAHILSCAPQAPWFICGPDKASMRFAFAEGFRDNVTSLEEMVDATGHRGRVSVGDAYGKRWLAGLMADLALGVRRR